MLKKLFERVVFSASVLSIILIPHAAQAETYVGAPYQAGNCCETEDSCCNPCIGKGLLIGAGIALGAAAGAIAASCQKGKKGSRGCPGPGQNTFFVRDEGQTLKFEEIFEVQASVRPGGFVRVVPIVITPDNETVQGVPMDVTAGGIFEIFPITIENPRFGYYEFGFVGEALLASGTQIIPHVIQITASRYPGDNLRDFLPNGAQFTTDEEQAGTITAPFLYFATDLPLNP